MGKDDVARGCGLAVLVMFAVFSIPGLYAVHKLAPCITGEVTTTTAVSADGQVLTATSPVCPEEGQTYVRAVGLAGLAAVAIVTAVLGTLAFNGLENIGLGWVAISRGQAPINATARDVTPDDRREYERHQADLDYKQVMTELAATRAEVERMKIDDRKGWTRLPANGAPATNGNGTGGNGSKGGGADLSEFGVMG